MQTMTQAQYAAHRGVGKPAVSNWKKAGLLVLVEDPAQPNKLVVDVMRTDARINARIDPMRGRPASTAPSQQPAASLPLEQAQPDGSTVSSERLELLREQKVGQALKNAQAAGDLVALIEGERRWGEAARMLRERLQSEMRGIAERLAAERDTRAVMGLCEETMDRVFSELAAEIEAGALDDEGEGETDGAPDSEAA